MNGLVRCVGCGHGLVAHGDRGCEERGCACLATHRSALETEIDRVRWRSHAAGAAPAGSTVVGGAEAGVRAVSRLGERVRELRVERGWSQAKLAAYAGVERTTLQRIEASKRQDPGFSIVASLARALGVPLESFVFDGGTEARELRPPIADRALVDGMLLETALADAADGGFVQQHTIE